MNDLINALDAVWLDISSMFNWFDRRDIYEGPLGEKRIINWDRWTVTLGDPIGSSTWRFKLDRYNNLVLYKGVDLVWNPDHNLSCWRSLEIKLKTIVNNEIEQILLEE